MKESISLAVLMTDEGSTSCLEVIVTVIYCWRGVSQNGDVVMTIPNAIYLMGDIG